MPWTAEQPSLSEPVFVEVRRICAFRKRKPDPVSGARRVGCERCGKAKLHSDHLGTPPSLNALVAGNIHALRAQKGAWQEALIMALQDAGMRRVERVFVEGECCFASARRRDGGNHRVLLEKALGDALTEGGWLEDDDWERFEFGRLSQVIREGESWTRLMLFPG